MISVRITLVISSLSGGVLKNFLMLASYWAEAAHQIALLTFDDSLRLRS
jgi:hypothetical protein